LASRSDPIEREPVATATESNVSPLLMEQL
jgi:hypothetical protein